MTKKELAAPEAKGSASGENAFSALRYRTFATLWMATVVGNVGTFMRGVASGWLVTELSKSPSTVAMVQAASTLPIFLLAIPSGVLSDIVDRRKLLIAVQIFLACTSATLAFLAATGKITVASLIALTFLGGTGAALVGPAWQSIAPDLVPKSELKGAIALNSLGFNIARAIGPALGGLLLATVGAALTYSIDVVSYLFVIAALLWWKHTPKEDEGLGERFGSALRAGFRYVIANKDLRRVLVRTALFFLFANVAWALLPIVARDLLGGGAGFYGFLLAAIGIGAISGAVIMPHLRKKLDPDGLIFFAALLMAVVLCGLSFVPPQWAGIVLASLFGVAWIIGLTTLNSTTQAVLPNWVRGRGLAVYLMTVNGAMTAGSIAWGTVGDVIGVSSALLTGGICLGTMALGVYWLKLPKGDADLTPSYHWPEPAISGQAAHERGPVLVTVQYQVQMQNRRPFIAAMNRLSEERRRDGAYAWGLTEDAANQEHILEWFFVESWAEHLRQHRRVSKADAMLQAEVAKYHTGDRPPEVTHFLTINGQAEISGNSPLTGSADSYQDG